MARKTTPRQVSFDRLMDKIVAALMRAGYVNGRTAAVRFALRRTCDALGIKIR